MGKTTTTGTTPTKIKGFKRLGAWNFVAKDGATREVPYYVSEAGEFLAQVPGTAIQKRGPDLKLLQHETFEAIRAVVDITWTPTYRAYVEVAPTLDTETRHLTTEALYDKAAYPGADVATGDTSVRLVVRRDLVAQVGEQTMVRVGSRLAYGEAIDARALPATPPTGASDQTEVAMPAHAELERFLQRVHHGLADIGRHLQSLLCDPERLRKVMDANPGIGELFTRWISHGEAQRAERVRAARARETQVVPEDDGALEASAPIDTAPETASASAGA